MSFLGSLVLWLLLSTIANAETTSADYRCCNDNGCQFGIQSVDAVEEGVDHVIDFAFFNLMSDHKSYLSTTADQPTQAYNLLLFSGLSDEQDADVNQRCEAFIRLVGRRFPNASVVAIERLSGRNSCFYCSSVE